MTAYIAAFDPLCRCFLIRLAALGIAQASLALLSLAQSLPPSGRVVSASYNPGCRSLRSLALGWELIAPSGRALNACMLAGIKYPSGSVFNVEARLSCVWHAFNVEARRADL